LRLLLLGVLPWTVVILAQARLRTEHRFGALTLLTSVFCVISLVLPVLAGLFAGAGTGMSAGWLAAVAVAALLAWGQTARFQTSATARDATVR
jgi:O-antigen/teichoic acid export membrane protein